MEIWLSFHRWLSSQISMTRRRSRLQKHGLSWMYHPLLSSKWLIQDLVEMSNSWVEFCFWHEWIRYGWDHFPGSKLASLKLVMTTWPGCNTQLLTFFVGHKNLEERQRVAECKWAVVYYVHPVACCIFKALELGFCCLLIGWQDFITFCRS